MLTGCLNLAGSLRAICDLAVDSTTLIVTAEASSLPGQDFEHSSPILRPL